MKKNPKDLKKIWLRKLTLKVKFGHFLTTHVKVSEIQIEKIGF